MAAVFVGQGDLGEIGLPQRAAGTIEDKVGSRGSATCR
jgi:hypothetical protein